MFDAVLNHDQVRNAYGRMTGVLNLVGVYEDIATRKLLPHAGLNRAENVFEFGCGTGRFAEHLLRDALPAQARYTAVDITPEMVASTRHRLAKYGTRAQVHLSDGSPPVSEPSATYDRFMSNYVFDLLPETGIQSILTEAHRMLRPGGLLCLSGLAPAQGPLSKVCVGLWSTVYKMRPDWVGGCRPIRIAPLLNPGDWRIRYQEIIIPFGFPLEILVAERVEA